MLVRASPKGRRRARPAGTRSSGKPGADGGGGGRRRTVTASRSRMAWAGVRTSSGPMRVERAACRRRRTSRCGCGAGWPRAPRRRAPGPGRGPGPACRCPTSTRSRPGTRRGARRGRAAVSKRYDGHRPGGTLDLNALAGQLVQPAAADLDGRDHRGDLLDVAGQRRRGLRHRLRRDVRHVVGGEDLAGGVERRGGACRARCRSCRSWAAR